MTYASIIDMIGGTPLVEFKTSDSGDARVFVKLESMNPTGSIKDRAAISNIMAAIETGDLTKDKIILDASSGNMACALSFYGKILGYKVKVICNTKLTQDKKQFIEYFGADLEVFGSITYEGNQQCKKLAEAEPDKYCFLDQLHNWNNPKASYRTLGPELLKDIPELTAVAGSMGSGGSMCGTSEYLRQNSPNTMVITSQAASGTKIPGTGAFVDGDYQTPFIHKLIDQKLYDDTFLVDQKDAEQRTKELAAQGIFAGIQGGGVLHALLRGIHKHELKGDTVMVIGDSGWKNMDKLKNI
jgi:[CysO sulfur-carrier protein]-thiocarboxylate-dependent cysteine synthase